MAKRTPPEFFDQLRPDLGPGWDDSVAADLVQRLLRTGALQLTDWDPTPLETACRTLLSSRHGSIRRIHTTIPCPRQPVGALPVAEYAQLLADISGLHVHCGLKNNNITVTFEQADSAR